MEYDVTLNCLDCALGPLSARYQDDDEYETAGFLATIAEKHTAAEPDHTVTWIRRTVKEAELQRAEQREQDAETARGVAERMAERKGASQRTAGSAGGHVYPWMD